MDRHEKKVADSKTRGKKIQARRTEWEELNEKIVGKENRAEEGSKEVSKKESGKEMEGVEVPDLEQPLPIRVVDDAAAENSSGAEVAPVPG
jgi:sortase (surface protein transpeptidase)